MQILQGHSAPHQQSSGLAPHAGHLDRKHMVRIPHLGKQNLHYKLYYYITILLLIIFALITEIFSQFATDTLNVFYMD